LAGTGTPGNSGNDGQATDADLDTPAGLGETAGCGFLIADFGDNEVREVSASGTITRVAGTGKAGKSGDDGPATDAQPSGPVGLALTADGGILIAARSLRAHAWDRPADSANSEGRQIAGSQPA
jgi:hypothetical protein